MSGIARESSSGGHVAPEELLLGSEDSLLSLEVGNFAGAHVGRDTTLGKQHRCFSGGMSIESRSVEKNMDIST